MTGRGEIGAPSPLEIDAGGRQDICRSRKVNAMPACSGPALNKWKPAESCSGCGNSICAKSRQPVRLGNGGGFFLAAAEARTTPMRK